MRRFLQGDAGNFTDVTVKAMISEAMTKCLTAKPSETEVIFPCDEGQNII